MKKFIATLLLFPALMMTSCGSIPEAQAAGMSDADFIKYTEAQMPDTSQTQVRVNGFMVDFPEGSEPYEDANGRAMIPVRFVADELGASVLWNESTLTATIGKGSTTVDITVGSPTLAVTTDGVQTTVTMDTVAVQNGGTLYVPIRYVAESLGAYVDYSDAYNVIGIYECEQGVEFIEAMMQYPLTSTDENLGYETAFNYDGAIKADFYYGPRALRDSFDDPETGFANSREFRYAVLNLEVQNYDLQALDIRSNYSDTDTTIALLIDEVEARLNYESDNLYTGFITNPALVFHEDDMRGGSISIRGLAFYIEYTRDLTTEEGHYATRYGIFNYAPVNTMVTVPIDIHVELQNSGCPAVLEVIHLEPQTPASPYQ